jgi:ubiquinone/menaquinone biosynthesis C-methylase UbiE
LKINIFEKLLIYNPIRSILHKHLEAKRLLNMGGKCNHALALEVGCGRGKGIPLIFDMFGVSGLHAFDLDEQAVRFARHNTVRYRERCRFWVGSVNHIPASNDTYDAIFDFGALHHVVDWRKSLNEIHRVLKPGGRIYLEEILSHYIVHPIVRKILYHPQADRFDLPMLHTALGKQGFSIKGISSLLNIYAWVIAEKPL